MASIISSSSAMMLGSAVGTKWPTRPRGRDRNIHISSHCPRHILKVVLRRKNKKEMFRSLPQWGYRVISLLKTFIIKRLDFTFDLLSKVLANEKRGRLKVVAFDRSPFKLISLRFSNKSEQAPSCGRPKTTQRTPVSVICIQKLFENNGIVSGSDTIFTS